jgi:hypothetical protein
LPQRDTVDERRSIDPRPDLHDLVEHQRHGGKPTPKGKQVNSEHESGKLEEPVLGEKKEAESQDRKRRKADQRPREARLLGRRI